MCRYLSKTARGGGFIPEESSLREGKVGLCLQLLPGGNEGSTDTFPAGKNQLCSDRKWLWEHSQSFLTLQGVFAAQLGGGILSWGLSMGKECRVCRSISHIPAFPSGHVQLFLGHISV